MFRTDLIHLVLAAAAGAGIAACAGADAPPAGGAEAPVIVAQDEIGARVAAAICDVHARCDRVGSAGKHPSVEVCVRDTAVQTADDIDAEDCQEGAVESKLDACLEALRAESCSSELDPGSLAACDEDLVCLQPGWSAGTPDNTTEHAPAVDRSERRP
jgi:hypothetical protein